MHDYDVRHNVLFFSQVAINGLSCWNPNKPLLSEEDANNAQQQQKTANNPHVLLRHDNQTMIYPSDLNVPQIG